MWYSAVGCIVTLTLSLLATPLATHAQPQGKLPRIGVLEPGHPPMVHPVSCSEGFKQRLRDLGYREGQTILLESRYAEVQYDRLPTLAAELVHYQPDVIWTHSNRAAQALKHATTTIPIVVAIMGNVVEQGLVESIARPGGNLTGLDMRQDEFTGKHLELLKVAVPPLTRVAVLVDRFSRPLRALAALEREAQALGLHLLPVEAGDPETYAGAFAAMAEHQAEGLVIWNTFRLANHKPRLLELALAHRLPTISFQRTWVEAGSLLSYGVNVLDMCSRSATYVDRILKGTKPTELPIEGPMQFELVINLKTAEALGLTMPPVLLFQADEVLK